MDDYSINSLTESKNEWCSRLISILTFSIIEGINSIFTEAIKLCENNDESNKYLMTFQNLLSKIPDWTNVTIENERNRIEKSSHCKYLEELVTCVHLVQLKALTCIRVGLRQKKIDIEIPDLNKFIHKCYINTARKIYSNVYLFEKDVMPLEKQKNNRELEILIKEALLFTIRENIPVEQILRVYLEETEEYEEIQDNKTEMELNKLKKEKEKENEKVKMENKEKIESKDYESQLESIVDKINNGDQNLENQIINNSDLNKDEKLNIEFSDVDLAVTKDGKKEEIIAPKDLESIEKRNEENKIKQSLYENEDDDDSSSLNIGDEINEEVEIIDLESDKKLKSQPIIDFEEL